MNTGSKGMWNEQTEKVFKANTRKMNLKLPMGKMRINYIYIIKSTARLRNGGHCTLGKGKIQNMSHRHFPRSPPRICTTGQLTVPHHSRRLKVWRDGRLEDDAETDGLSQSCIKLWDTLRPIHSPSPLSPLGETKLPVAGLHPLQRTHSNNNTWMCAEFLIHSWFQ